MTEEESFKLTEELANHVVKTTQHIVMIDSVTNMPSSLGSGCIIVYNERPFLISVQHVTDKVGKKACIDLGIVKDNEAGLYCVGAMNFVDQYEVTGLNTDNPELLELRPLDITYVELKGDFEAFQKEGKFDDYTISADNKRIHFAEEGEIPTKQERYNFFGRIRPAFNGRVLEQQEKLVLGIEYDCKVGYFERFILHDIITDHSEYKGTSGAPIISESGKVVAFVANGVGGTKHLYGFSSKELKKFLDIYIEQNPVN